MNDQQNCPHCGAITDAEYPNKYYGCGTHINDPTHRFGTCYERQIEQLQDALNKINARLPQQDSDGNLFTAYIDYDGDGDVEFGPVNAGALVLEIAAIIAEVRGEVK